ncbi:MAG: sulfite exporter TauE/SafE family protein [Deltaproteobacteria bacterium]
MSLAQYASALALGALGSAHCVAMCGGVAGLFCAAEPADARAAGRNGLAYVLAYNTGRALSYGSAGIVLGGAGAAAVGHNEMLGPQYALRAVAALAFSSWLGAAGDGRRRHPLRRNRVHYPNRSGARSGWTFGSRG